VKAVPVREGHNLEMMFPITPEIQNYTAAPSRYLGHLIGHEADGSLFALLKKLGENIYK
jgi:insulysin